MSYKGIMSTKIDYLRGIKNRPEIYCVELPITKTLVTYERLYMLAERNDRHGRQAKAIIEGIIESHKNMPTRR